MPVPTGHRTERKEKKRKKKKPRYGYLGFITSAPLGNGPAWYLLRCHPRALSRREQKNSGDTCGCHFHKRTRLINASGQLAPLAAAAHHPLQSPSDACRYQKPCLREWIPHREAPNRREGSSGIGRRFLVLPLPCVPLPLHTKRL
ncbi:hypothetical protein CPAR01_14020 [Colletotrichum paranaense]|uniref:Uncharacterized protein n=1 Tax=Colletotrichum paranaense TaxID=1914294 RepID=A0ABQ9S2Y0_9PEZI|nr:uncharacterized protein CPAR01_14020 [Colletotrichum paranaense]KAK1523167.1 hypothetical protein CPAR01_14020 [Colletotrichum paranaense]